MRKLLPNRNSSNRQLLIVILILALPLIVGNRELSASSTPPLSFICNPFPPHKINNGPMDRPGFDIELIQAALLKEKLASTFAFAPWRRAYEMAAKGEYSGLCSCSYRLERNPDFLFSDELGEVSIGFFTRKNFYLHPKSIDDLRGYQVGVVDGYNLKAELVEKHIFATLADSDKGLAKMLQQQRIDIAFSFRDSFWYYARRENSPVPLTYQKLRISPYYVCISKRTPNGEALRKAINQGLKKIRADGTYNRIRSQYLDRQMN